MSRRVRRILFRAALAGIGVAAGVQWISGGLSPPFLALFLAAMAVVLIVAALDALDSGQAAIGGMILARRRAPRVFAVYVWVMLVGGGLTMAGLAVFSLVTGGGP